MYGVFVNALLFICIGISEERLSEFKGVFQDASFECWETNIACGGATLHSVNSVTSSIP